MSGVHRPAFMPEDELPVFRPPPGRVYRVTKWDYDHLLDDWDREDDDPDMFRYLDEEYGMMDGWDPDDVGTLHVELVNGNHRLIASYLAGESHIPIMVLPNYRDEIRDEEWLIAPS